MRATATALIVLAIGCDRGTSARPGDTTARVAPPDTTVRLVRRYLQQPAAIQRVTGSLPAGVALRPLDSVLAVRVLDSRGGALDSIPVVWSVVTAGDSATLRVIDAITDSLGVSRAEFTPGRSADAQRVAAEVAGVARIEFAVTIPARAVRLSPAEAVLWAGDDTTLLAALHDATGMPLTGGQLAWASGDTTTVRIQSFAATTARVHALAAGSTQLFAFAESGKVRGVARLLVRPVVRGQFVTLDGSTAPEMAVVIESEGIRAPLATARGAFDARIPFTAGADVTVRATPPAGAPFHALAVRVGAQRELQSLSIALVPTRFTIDAGTYRGRDVPIDAASAMRRPGRGASFWRVVPLSGDTPRKLLGWRDADYPLRVAFNRAASGARIDAADSAAFWAIATVVEEDLGRDLFAPAEMADSARGNLVRVEIRAQASEGHTFVAWEQAGDAHEGIVILASSATLRDAHVVSHELAHLLGFGHATGWPSVTQAAGGTAPRLTVEDVAYIQLAMRLRSLQERAGARPGLP